MRIEVLSVGKPAHVDNGKGGYNKIEVAYKDKNGNITGKSIVDFGKNEEVYNFFLKAKQGDTVDVESVKEGKYWNWLSASKASADDDSEGDSDSESVSVDEPRANPRNKTTGGGRGKVTGSNYETPEERAIRRAFDVKKHKEIGRQGCINSAVNILATQGNSVSVDEVLGVAKQLIAFVFDEDEPVTPSS